MKSAFPQTNSPCEITLYRNIPFDNTYKHHSFISKLFKYNDVSLTELDITPTEVKESFINRPADISGIPPVPKYPHYGMTGEFNFDFKNGLIGSVTLELVGEDTNANYLKLKCENEYYYYFITGITQDNYNTYTLSLELDVLMTYQDEFLVGMKDIPVFTSRKHSHRYANNTGYIKCADLKLSDDIFSGVKPSITLPIEPLEIKGELNKLKDIKWLYICVDGDFFYDDSTPDLQQLTHYKFKDIEHPLCMCVIPLNMGDLTIGYWKEGVYGSITLSKEHRRLLFKQLIGSGKVHSCKVSPYPPFIDSDITISHTGDNYTIVVPYSHFNNDYFVPVWVNEKSSLFFDSRGEDGNSNNNHRCFVICNETGKAYEHYSYFIHFPYVTPSVLNTRNIEPKLFFKPFRKYYLTSSYSEGNEFFPEIVYSNGYITAGEFKFETCYNFYIGDYSIFTYQTPLLDNNNVTHYVDYRMNNIGLSSSMNYIIPSGTNALDVFNSTQAQSFYQSKTASGITSGLTIAGGIGSIALGLAGVIPTAGASTSLIAGGVTAIAGGVASMSNAIKSTTAKIEDLKNTPDAVNVQGGSFVGDWSRYNPIPYISVYECSEVIKKQADDYYYNYGYQVGRYCYFNTELYFDNNGSGVVDNNLFGRSIFNYVQLNEDITNKIDVDIPIIVKQKISNIFNQGITLWSFFFSYNLYNNPLFPSNACPTDNYFMKNIYDNTEYNGNRP